MDDSVLYRGTTLLASLAADHIANTNAKASTGSKDEL